MILQLGICAVAMALWVIPVWVLWWHEACCEPRQTRAQRRAARLRAERLLARSLHPQEAAQLRRCGYLAIPSPTIPHRVYRIPRRREVVTVYEHGRPVLELCVQPATPLPAAEVVLMHKLLIEGAEADYLRLANAFPVSPLRWW